MKSIIVAYPIKATAIQIKNVLEDEGFYVSHICATGASVLNIASEMRGGIIICASILRDMSAAVMAECLPAGFDIIALTKGGRQEYMGNYIPLPLPLDRIEFIKTVRILVSSESSFTNRTRNEAEYISRAKHILMGADDMTEMQAHKYIQQLSMNQSKSMVDIAKEIIDNFS